MWNLLVRSPLGATRARATPIRQRCPTSVAAEADAHEASQVERRHPHVQPLLCAPHLGSGHEAEQDADGGEAAAEAESTGEAEKEGERASA